MLSDAQVFKVNDSTHGFNTSSMLEEREGVRGRERRSERKRGREEGKGGGGGGGGNLSMNKINDSSHTLITTVTPTFAD